MKGFYWYSVVAVILSGISLFNLLGDTKFLHLALIINKISFIFHYAFLSLFIFRALNVDALRRIFIPLFFAFLLCILVLLFETILQADSFLINSLTNFFLVTFSLFYYYDLFGGKPVRNLFNQSSFWVISGLFLCLTVTIPLNVMKTLLVAKNDMSLNLFITNTAIFFYAVMHLFFIKAYSCSINPTKA